MRIEKIALFILLISLPLGVYSQQKIFDEEHASYTLAQDFQQQNVDIKNAESDSALVYSYLEAAGKAKSQGEMRRQRIILGEAQRVADSLAKPTLLQAVEKDLGDYYLETSSYDSAQTVLKRAVERSSNIKIQTQVLNLLATAYRYQSKYPEAMSTYNQGLALIDSLESPDIYMAISTNKASIHESLGNLSEAISLYQQGISFAEAVGDSSFLATALNNLGNLYYEQSNYEDAQTYLNESITVSEEQGLYNTLLRAKHNLASTERDHGNYDEARKLFKEAWLLHGKVRPDSPPVQLLYNMGVLHLAVSELDEAEEHFQESLEYSQKGGIPAGLFYNFVGLGDVALARGDFSASTNFYNDSFGIAKKINSPPMRITASEKLYEAYKEQGDFEQALGYHEIAKQESDSLKEVQQNEQLALAETELGLRQQQKINQLLQERQDQQEARIFAQNWLIALTVAILVIILISFSLLYRANAEKKRINAQLASQRNRLEELNAVKSKMLAIIAHDLRSPIASMQGMLYLIRENDLTMEEIREMTTELEISVNENISMMDNLLVWAREQMSGLTLQITSVPAFKIVEEVLSNFELQADQKDILLTNNVDKDLIVNADLNLMKLILRNLISNSIKFCEAGDKVTVYTREKGNKVIFKVQDTGIGIAPDKQEHLFSVNGESQLGTLNEKGSGLGLQLCKEFIEKQNGEIKLESKEGEGTVFSISLPKAS